MPKKQPTTKPEPKQSKATPGTTAPEAADEAKKGPPKKKPYVEEGQQLETVPTDFNKKVHAPLKRKDFAEEWMWFEWKANELTKDAEKYRKEAETIKKLGSKADRAKARRLLQMQKKMAELEAQLKEKGYDIEEITG
jgi:hypothetical protein